MATNGDRCFYSLPGFSVYRGQPGAHRAAMVREGKLFRRSPLTLAGMCDRRLHHRTVHNLCLSLDTRRERARQHC